ncbi:ribonuclease H-like domain-containing protein [Thiocapsa sp.]|uniref:ribonuclease H-like domain-containing protein n=1 Tax=Thiocapsa sp. TaxID=2024551 RepID=UPI002CF877EF|nr:ribonuclease H-like domain-containing protein [Thiocapsa sp.]HSO82862.1 ribonuclease H-like domain-containing protein [Thiocapsa sp.]
MTLKDRLQRLRGAGPGPDGQGSVPSSPTDRPSLAERIRRVSVGQARAGGASEPGADRLAEAVGAVEIAPGVLCLERRIPARERHGQVSIGPFDGAMWEASIDPGWVSPASRLEPELERGRSVPAAAAPVCLDTETSGLAGGTGTWAFMTGLLRAQADGWTLRQYLLTRLDAEPAYLEAIAAELSGAGLLVSYNGLSFDIPLLATRFRLSGQADPLPALPHLDLLKPVRRAYGRIWPDCRLASVEQRLLGFKRKDDLPGSEAPAAWLAWLRAGEVTPLVGVLRHNRWDLLSLAALIPRLSEVFADPGAFDADVRAVAAYHQAQGRSDRAFELLRSERRRLEPAGLLDLARLYRRRGDWDSARAIWEPLAVQGDAEARTELAKYHEHRTRDLRRALAIAHELPPGPLKERRCARLNAKLDARDGGSSALMDALAATLDGSISFDRPPEP